MIDILGDIGFWALLVALCSLSWNIVRDFIIDRTKVELSLALGESGNIKDSNTGLFADAGTFDTPITQPELLLTIINTGRRHIYVSRVGGKYVNPPEKDKTNFSMVVIGLPRKLEPYEVFSTFYPVSPILLRSLQEHNIESMWVVDTKEKKWTISSKNWERLQETVDSLSKLNNII